MRAEAGAGLRRARPLPQRAGPGETARRTYAESVATKSEDCQMRRRLTRMTGVRRLWRSVLDRLTVYDAGPPLEALAAELGRPDLVRLSANENPLGPSPRAVAAITREAGRVHLYPDGGSTALRAAL